ncbi:protein hook homolog [Saccostrea cucullata]|uniref:protein hook homolog n=1 Tax=Saccostrea cuccullata TaxID=36930 RepID=UPI002ED0F642
MTSKLKAVRAGQRSAVTRLQKRQDEENADAEEIEAILETLTDKQEILRDLDEKILTETAEEDIEREILETDDENSRTHQTFTSFHSNPNSANFHKLPKLNLPIFEENVLEWQSVWDSFDSAIHSNNTLTEVQKFNYLKSLLAEEASNTISGFALTHANYNRAIELLHERFVQKHKITQSYMQALLDLPAPKNNPTSLRHFHDQVETYVRGLESYGQAQDTYGSLLVPVILNKLPCELRKNLAREHGSTDWLLGDLRKALYKELDILEAGTHMDTTEDHATAIFYMHSESSDEQPQRNYSPRNHRGDIVLRNASPNPIEKSAKKNHHTSLCTAHNAVKTKRRNTHKLQAKAELDARTREIKNLQDKIKNYKSVIATLEQQISRQKILTEKTIKDVNILHTQFAELQFKFDAQLIATNQMTAENQDELKKKEGEVNMLKQEIQRLKSSRETPARKLQQVGENIHSDVKQQRETPKDQITCLKRESEISKKLDNVHKNNLEQSYREAIKEKINIINQLEKEQNRYTSENNNLTRNYAEDNKVHSMQIVDFKRISVDDTNIRQQENTFKTFRDVERTYSQNLIESRDEIAEMKRRVKIMNHQIDQHKGQIQAKENAFIMEYFGH